MRHLVGVPARVITVLAVGWVVGWVVERLTSVEQVGANIGAGLAAMAAGALVVLVWSVLDGRSRGWPALVTWGSVALVIGLLNGGGEYVNGRRIEDVPTVGNPGQEFAPTPDPWSMALSGFLFALFVPLVIAVIGVAIGSLSGRRDPGSR